jgi:hypothetical protein
MERVRVTWNGDFPSSRSPQTVQDPPKKFIPVYNFFGGWDASPDFRQVIDFIV